MKTSTHKHTNMLGFLGMVILSSVTMVWLFWHYPRGTGIATIVVLAAFGISARLARWVDSEGARSEHR